MKRFLFSIALSAVCALLLVCNFSFAAETTASIIGTVSDSNHAALPGAAVTAVNQDTNFTRTTTTDALGFFPLPRIRLQA